MSKKRDLLSLIPMEEYQTPKYPTFADDKPNLKNQIPRRWKSRAIIAMAAGLLGTSALTGCFANISAPTESAIYCPELHYGGAGAAPLYVVHLTEAEALGIIRSQLEEIGLSLTEVAPLGVTIDNVYVECDWQGDALRMFNNDVEMQLLDDENQVGIALVNRHWDWRLDGQCTIDTQARIAQRFLSEYDLFVGVIFPRSYFIDEAWGDDAVWDEERFAYVDDDFEERVDDARIHIEKTLIEQTQNFIQQLREEGIID